VNSNVNDEASFHNPNEFLEKKKTLYLGLVRTCSRLMKAGVLLGSETQLLLFDHSDKYVIFHK
jgi:hypothetical protein